MNNILYDKNNEGIGYFMDNIIYVQNLAELKLDELLYIISDFAEEESEPEEKKI